MTKVPVNEIWYYIPWSCFSSRCRRKGYIAFKKEAKAGKLDVTEIEDFQQLLDTFLYLRDHETKYKTVIVDSMTGLSNMAILSYLEAKGKRLVWRQLRSGVH